MTKSRWLGVLLAIVAAAAVLALWPRRPLSPEEVIRRKITQMSEAAEEKDLGFIMEQVSSDFRLNNPPLNRDELKGFLAAQILRGQWVRVFVRDMDVTVTSPTTAVFRGKFIFGRSTSDTLERLAAESQIQAYQVDADVRQEQDGEWRFVGASYRVIPPGQLF